MAFPGPHHPPQVPKPPKLPVPLTTDYFDQRLRPIFILCIATLSLTLTVSVGYVRSRNQYRKTSTTRGPWPTPSGDGAPSRSGDEADIESYPYTINGAGSPPASTLNAGNNPYSTEQWQWISTSRTPEMETPATGD
ncbi:uncharacterized protein EURHEDRAFT_402991 [Aspergillus ruber CBS 135680]|uniref:Uncharacterized protein n=1 Tax=Aspergillus ruber (strain CBS 135680) TaxID=1388766 RepID=A0A017SE20_ASPRC|nr:uncharacterized protein EURHEDRAFT_402991 [Aspergillus ruber CBS 135680]EYE94884.1 hypothetical protein EURHEDRAFT_402991 [Aspergillus ruber CBS 135680]